MSLLYQNLTGSTGVTTQLLSPSSSGSNVRSITIANTAASTGTISIFIQPGEGAGGSLDKLVNTFYLIKDVAVPSGATLLLDNPGVLTYDASKYSLNSTIGGSDTFSIKIS
jgi:hypothetical protein